MSDWPEYSPTRCPQIGLSRCPGRTPSATVWRWVHTFDIPAAGPAVVGPLYRTRAEALGDLTDYLRRSNWEV